MTNHLYTPFVASFIVLTLTGILNASYLVWKHYQKKPLTCPINNDCSIVTESQWSRIFYIRNEVLGLLFFSAMFIAMAGAFFLPLFSSLSLLFMIITSAVGVLFSIMLTLLQLIVIQKYCFYCLISAFITVLLFLNAVAL